MVKEPRPGRVKTRLGADIGLVQSAWWFRHQSQRLIRKLSNDPRWQTVLAVSPDAEGLASRSWPSNVARVPQGQGNLGDRMARVFRNTLPGPVAIIGADIPDISPKHVARAFRALGNHDAVFGPAFDGGYWLVGLKCNARVPPGIFKGVRWSSEFALADSEASLKGRQIARIETLQDIDTAKDL
ncbi:MAG: rSAM/selenodomain-associated transferase 1 [Paracoccaceae bacterium]|jgi:rSAM/selenodomain-associated transferase 1